MVMLTGLSIKLGTMINPVTHFISVKILSIRNLDVSVQINSLCVIIQTKKTVISRQIDIGIRELGWFICLSICFLK